MNQNTEPLFRFVQSKRGSIQVFYDGNTYTPNDKKLDGKRSYKCSMYYKKNCKARLITKLGLNNQTTLKVSSEHTHPKMYQTEESVNRLFNYK